MNAIQIIVLIVWTAGTTAVLMKMNSGSTGLTKLFHYSLVFMIWPILFVGVALEQAFKKLFIEGL